MQKESSMAWKAKAHYLKRLLDRALNNIGCCDLCAADVHSSYLLAQPLQQSLICQYCVDDLPYFKQELLCANLLNWPAVYKALPNIHFDKLFALAPYSYPFDTWLAQFKYSGRFELANLFSALLSAQWQSSLMAQSHFDLVLSVPLHSKKWQLRGYNQAHLIAQNFAKQLSLPYDADLLIRIKNNDSQMGKTGAQRRKNLRNNFSLKQDISSKVKHVLLIDDVVTTGTTASEISKLLKQAGVQTVTLVTVCLSLPNK